MNTKRIEVTEQIQEIATDKIIPFSNSPFKVKDDQEMMELVDSIKRNGIITPIIIRRVCNDQYEVISGHRRLYAMSALGEKMVLLESEQVSMFYRWSGQLLLPYFPAGEEIRSVRRLPLWQASFLHRILHCSSNGLFQTEEGNVLWGIAGKLRYIPEQRGKGVRIATAEWSYLDLMILQPHIPIFFLNGIIQKILCYQQKSWLIRISQFTGLEVVVMHGRLVRRIGYEALVAPIVPGIKFCKGLMT